ncbi:MAG TPA: HK97 gp10 family phage protein [Roseiflexaceae bacterium]|nr:HK97 gp10 family phage protein [Roseiflexaceae bacterium]
MTPDQFANRFTGAALKAELTQAMQRIVLTGEGYAKAEAPVKRGTLRRSITSRVEAGGRRGVIGTNLRYARPVHDGSRAHTIRPVRARALFWKGAKHPVRVVHHPGTHANPFFARAMRRLQPDADKELQAAGYHLYGRVS